MIITVHSYHLLLYMVGWVVLDQFSDFSWLFGGFETFFVRIVWLVSNV